MKILVVIFTIILTSSKTNFPFTSCFPFFRKNFWNPETSLGFLNLIANAKVVRSRARRLCAIVYFLYNNFVFKFGDNIFLLGTTWPEIFSRAIRNLSGDIKLSPGNNLGNSFSFLRKYCRLETKF